MRLVFERRARYLASKQEIMHEAVSQNAEIRFAAVHQLMVLPKLLPLLLD